MATFTCYLPNDVLQRLDEKLGEGPDFNYGKASRSGLITLLLERHLGDQPSTVRGVFSEALGANRAESFRRATQ